MATCFNPATTHPASLVNAIQTPESRKPHQSSINHLLSKITSEQIQDVAEHIITQVMERLGVGILGEAPISCRFNYSVQGEVFPIMGTKYNPKCSLLQKLKPIIVKHLTKAFPNGKIVMDRDIEIVLFNRKGTGILPRDVLVKKILDDYMLHPSDWKIRLQANSEYTHRYRKLIFINDELMNGGKVGCSIFSTDMVRNAARQCFLNTFEV